MNDVTPFSQDEVVAEMIRLIQSGFDRWKKVEDSTAIEQRALNHMVWAGFLWIRSEGKAMDASLRVYFDLLIRFTGDRSRWEPLLSEQLIEHLPVGFVAPEPGLTVSFSATDEYKLTDRGYHAKQQLDLGEAAEVRELLGSTAPGDGNAAIEAFEVASNDRPVSSAHASNVNQSAINVNPIINVSPPEVNVTVDASGGPNGQPQTERSQSEPPERPTNKSPSLADRDTHHAYSAMHDYLIRNDESSPSQKRIYESLDWALDNEIDRDTVGISESYTRQKTFSAFIEAYRRYQRFLEKR